MRPLHVKPCLPSSTPPPLPNPSTQSSCPDRPHHPYLSSFHPLINREDNLSPLQRQNVLFGDMAEYHPQYLQLHQPDQQLRTRHVVKAATAVTAGGSLLVLSALTLAGTVVALIIATPLMVIFSPVLIPAVIATGLLVTGFLTSGGFGIAAVTVLSWIYRYMTGKHPPGTDQLDQARLKLASKAREMKDRVEQFGHQHLTTTTTTTQ